MSTAIDDVREKMRRSINCELSIMEDDFDNARHKRNVIVDKLMSELDKISFTDEQNNFKKDSVIGVSIINQALKALKDSESSRSTIISLKLKQQEQQIISSAAAKNRIAVIIEATTPGRITQEFPEEELESQLEELFGKDIKDFELKTNNRDLSE